MRYKIVEILISVVSVFLFAFVLYKINKIEDSYNTVTKIVFEKIDRNNSRLSSLSKKINSDGECSSEKAYKHLEQSHRTLVKINDEITGYASKNFYPYRTQKTVTSDMVLLRIQELLNKHDFNIFFELVEECGIDRNLDQSNF